MSTQAALLTNSSQRLPVGQSLLDALLTSLLDFLLQNPKRVNTFVSIDYTKYYILTTVSLDFDVKQVPWTHSQGSESTDPIAIVHMRRTSNGTKTIRQFLPARIELQQQAEALAMPAQECVPLDVPED